MALSSLDTFVWGAIGGAVGYVLVFLLPWFSQLARGEIAFQMSWGRAVGVFGLFLAYVSLGGAAAILIGDATETKHAMAYGLGFEGILKGALEARR